MNTLFNVTGLRWLRLTMSLLVIDLTSKFFFIKNFYLGDKVSILPFLNLYYTRNYGAAFNFLANSSGWQRWFFSGIAIGICIILIAFMYKSKVNQRLKNISYALIIEGALSNLFDRLYHGYVIDMIDFYIGTWHFATFNFADSAICVGAALILLEGFLKNSIK